MFFSFDKYFVFYKSYGLTVFTRMFARDAHLKVGIRGEALIRGGGWGGGGGAHSRGHSFKNQRFRGVGGSFDRETAVILEAELKKRKELFSHFDFTVENIPIAKFPAVLSKNCFFLVTLLIHVGQPILIWPWVPKTVWG